MAALIWKVNQSPLKKSVTLQRVAGKAYTQAFSQMV